jgi:hypothetical protein
MFSTSDRIDDGWRNLAFWGIGHADSAGQKLAYIYYEDAPARKVS